MDGRFLEFGDSHVRNFSFLFGPPGDGSLFSRTMPMGTGAILNLSVRTVDVGAVRGMCYLRVDVVRGTGPAAGVVGTLLSGYVSSGRGIAWPGSPLEDPMDGRGWHHLQQSAVPAAGADCVQTVPTQTDWRLYSVDAQLTTSAVAGNRSVFLVLKQSGVVLWRSMSSLAQPPSSSRGHTWMAGASNTPATGILAGLGSLPVDFRINNLAAAMTIETSTVGIDAGDQWTSLSSFVEERRNPNSSWS